MKKIFLALILGLVISSCTPQSSFAEITGDMFLAPGFSVDMQGDTVAQDGEWMQIEKTKFLLDGVEIDENYPVSSAPIGWNVKRLTPMTGIISILILSGVLLVCLLVFLYEQNFR